MRGKEKKAKETKPEEEHQWSRLPSYFLVALYEKLLREEKREGPLILAENQASLAFPPTSQKYHAVCRAMRPVVMAARTCRHWYASLRKEFFLCQVLDNLSRLHRMRVGMQSAPSSPLHIDEQPKGDPETPREQEAAADRSFCRVC